MVALSPGLFTSLPVELPYACCLLLEATMQDLARGRARGGAEPSPPPLLGCIYASAARFGLTRAQMSW